MKVTIVGTGHVGATLAYVCVLEGLADRLVLINRDRRAAEGHALDLRHTASLVPHPIRVQAGDIAASSDSDVVVITMSVPMDREKPNRRDLAEGNAALFKQWLPRLAEASPGAVFLIVTNPVDVMTWATLQITSLSPDQVCGIGTLVDSARFRSLMAEEIGIHPDDIRAYVIGEHGQSQVAAISVASVGGEQIDASLQRAHQFAEMTVDSGIEIFRLKGHTNFAVAKATAVVIEAIQHNQLRTLPLSVLLDGFCDVDDVCLSVPVVIGRGGVSRRLHPRLTPAEQAAFQKSAAQVRESNRQILPILKPESLSAPPG